jgi:hypothetical protein
MLDATLLLRAYARHRRRRLHAERPVETQQAVLLKLLHTAKDTAFGRAYRFDGITSVEAFQAAVPLRRYEDFWHEWWQPAYPRLVDTSWPGLIRYFAVSSGTTTGNNKYIPVSKAMMMANRKAAFDVLVHHLAARPDTRVLAGRSFMLGGTTDLVRQAPGVFSGDLSGIAAADVPFWARPRYFPPNELGLLNDWDRKTDLMAALSLRSDIRSISGTPSWVLPFFGKLAKLRPGGVTDWYPNLELFIHGGVNFAPYQAQFRDLFAGTRIDMREVYPASEGFFAIADRGYGDGLRLILDNGLFLEFVPADEIDSANPTRHWIKTAQTGVNYAVVLSSNAGLWSYIIGDTVRFVDLYPPRVLVTGRLSYMLSAFGEHLIGEEIDTAIHKAAAAVANRIVEYAVAPEFPSRPDELGRHCFVVEPVSTEFDVDRFSLVLDTTLTHMNADYAAHREMLRAPHVVVAPAGTFAAWMKHRGRAGGQNKVPRVINDPALFQDLRTFVAQAAENR